VNYFVTRLSCATDFRGVIGAMPRAKFRAVQVADSNDHRRKQIRPRNAPRRAATNSAASRKAFARLRPQTTRPWMMKKAGRVIMRHLKARFVRHRRAFRGAS